MRSIIKIESVKCLASIIKIHWSFTFFETLLCKYVILITDLTHIKDRSIDALSGGELQRFACAMVCIQDGDIFMFDEPSSYLDVKQRLNAAVTIRSLIHPDK